MTKRTGGRRTGAAAVIVASAVVCLFHLPATAQCQYEVTAIIQGPECSIGGYPVTYGIGLDEHGRMVGYHECPVSPYGRPFLWTPEEGYQLLPLPSGVFGGRANDINDNGQIACTLDKSGVGKRGFIHDLKTGEWTELPPVNPEHGWSTANAINNAGQVVGYRSISDGVNPYNAFIWSQKEGFTDLGVMEGPYSSASDVSESGVTVGWTGSTFNELGFVWVDGKLAVLEPIPGGSRSWVQGVSPNGRYKLVSGVISLPEGTVPRAFVLQGDRMLDLGVLPGYDGASPVGVNDARQVVGACRVAGESNWHPFLWQHGEMFDLIELVEAGFPVQIEYGSRVNNRGQIAAVGNDDSGDIVTYLLTPVGRPDGDVNIDCRVDVYDLLKVLAEWGPGDSIADLNDDGTVDVLDLFIVLECWEGGPR